MTRLRFIAALLVALLAGSGCAITGNVSGNEVVAYFDDVGDLVVGGTVQVDDVEIGLVKGIDLRGDDKHWFGRQFAAEARELRQDHLEVVHRITT